MYSIETSDSDRLITLRQAIDQGEAHYRHVMLHDKKSVACYDNADPENPFLFLSPEVWEQEAEKIQVLVRENPPGRTWIDAVVL